MDTWGLVSKAQDNPQTIDKAIAAAISNHEADSEAHLGAGESLETHRGQDVIDHPAESIVSDKINNSTFRNKLFLTSFYSLDVFQYVASTSSISINAVRFNSSLVLNNIAWLGLVYDAPNGASFSLNPILDIRASFSVYANHEVYIGIGDFNDVYGESFAGFKILNGTWYARTYSYAGGAETLVNLGSLGISGYKSLRIEVESGVEVRFYVACTLVATITTNLPEDTETFPMVARAKTKSTGQPAFWTILPFTFEQDQ